MGKIFFYQNIYGFTPVEISSDSGQKWAKTRQLLLKTCQFPIVLWGCIVQWSIFCAARKLWRVQISAKEVIANSWSANSTYLYLWHLFVELVIVTPVWSGGTLYQWSLQPEKERYGQFVVKLDNSKLGSTRQWIQSKWIWWSWMQSGYCHHFLLCQGTNTMRCFFAASGIFI